ncbi:MAG: hypothetical protein ACTSWN_06245, partial [Promethearchaeota archaeon]
MITNFHSQINDVNEDLNMIDDVNKVGEVEKLWSNVSNPLMSSYPGEELWNRTFGDIYIDYGYSTCSDGTYIYTCGDTSSYGAGSEDLILIKWDHQGNKIWNQTWGGTSGDYGESVWYDGAYIYTCGSTLNFGAGQSDLVLIKWDTSGNIIWNRTIGGSSDDFGK